VRVNKILRKKPSCKLPQKKASDPDCDRPVTISQRQDVSLTKCDRSFSIKVRRIFCDRLPVINYVSIGHKLKLNFVPIFSIKILKSRSQIVTECTSITISVKKLCLFCSVGRLLKLGQ